MTTITAADLATVRRRSGDKAASATGYDLTDAEIDALYISTTLGNLDLNRTTFYVLVERYGIAVNSIDQSGETNGINESRSQKFDHLEKLLKLYSSLTGIAWGATITVGTVNTYRADSRQTSEPVYPVVSTLLTSWDDV